MPQGLTKHDAKPNAVVLWHTHTTYRCRNQRPLACGGARVFWWYKLYRIRASEPYQLHILPIHAVE